MDVEHKVSSAEIKAGLNLAKEVFKVLATDSEKVAGLKRSLSMIDTALKSGDEELLLSCNNQITQLHGDIIFNPCYHFRPVSEAEMRQKSFADKFYSLREIGTALQNAIFGEKLGEGAKAALKVGVEYAFDKLSEKK